jgi:cardiolipin synthase
MEHFRGRDLLLLPNLVSLLRLPLAIAFVFGAGRPGIALAILLASGATDVLDGFLARRLGQATATGAVVDGAMDKGFAATVLATLLLDRQLRPFEALLLGVREVGELPLVLWWVLHHEKRRARAADPRANWLGKFVTCLQFAAIAAVLWGSPLRQTLLVLTAIAGAISALVYWRREAS